MLPVTKNILKQIILNWDKQKKHVIIILLRTVHIFQLTYHIHNDSTTLMFTCDN